MENRYIPDQSRYAALARRAAAEGCVLLRNIGDALPLRQGERVAVFGRIQFDYYKSGTGSGGLVNTKYVVGISDALKEEDLILDHELEEVYREWLLEHPFDHGTGWAQEPWSQEEMPVASELAERAAQRNDAALVILGRTAGEDQDAAAEKGSYLLTDTEEEMLENVSRAFERTIVVLNVGSIIDMKWAEKYSPSAILYVWQGGMEGGHGVADVLTGRVNPCGKLTDTIAYDITDYPSSDHFGGDSGDIYAEDIYVGYRYFETFAKDRVMYPFGYGLSYTTFRIECSAPEQISPVRSSVPGRTLSRSGKSPGNGNTADPLQIRLQVTVRNTGHVPGREVVQVYVKAPQGKLGKPIRSLTAFYKTGTLLPGEEEKTEITVDGKDFASYDDSGASGHKACYVLEPGNYDFYVGADVRSAVCAGRIQVEELIVTEVCRESAAPLAGFPRMRPGKAWCGCRKTEEDGNYEIDWEEVPVRTKTMEDHIRQDMPEETGEEIPYIGDRGIRLGDVYDGGAEMRDFLSQLSDRDLCCIVKGEGMGSPKVTPGTAAAFGGLTSNLKRFGIPCGCCADGPSGIRMDCGTHAFSLPNGVCLASTFDTELMEDLYEMTGAELRLNRIDTLLGPGMNIHRNPLNGRNFEYFSEDPLLTGKIAAAELRGMARFGVTGTIKHFAANNQEHSRRRYDSVLSERALREIYLRGFEIAVKEGGAHSLMTSYGAVNGIWTASNYDLVTGILRREWGYDGMVMTDWWAEMNEEGEEPSIMNLAAMIRAQNDVFMVVPDTVSHMGNLEESLKSGHLTRGMLARSAGNILRMLMRSPVMDRFLDRVSGEEKAAFESLEEEERPDFDLVYHEVDGECALPADEICTDRGSSKSYGLKILDPGEYSLVMEGKADAGELAQIPVSVFLNGTLAGTVTINGTDGKWIRLEQPLGNIVFPNNYLRLYFAQSGLQIRSIRITEQKKEDDEGRGRQDET